VVASPSKLRWSAVAVEKIRNGNINSAVNWRW
jgi:hypothetical protein